jgi:hypothetical protein
MNRQILLIALLFSLFVLHHASSAAQSGAGYDLTWSQIGGGGGTFSTGGGYSLGGSVGQPDAGRLGGGEYTLTGGFWTDATIYQTVNLPVIRKP